MSQDKLSLQVTVYVPADRNQSAPRDTTPFVVFLLSVTGPVLLFLFLFNPPHFSEAVPKIIKVRYLDPFFLLTVITEFELYFVLLFDLVYTGGCSPHSVCNAVQSVI